MRLRTTRILGIEMSSSTSGDRRISTPPDPTRDSSPVGVLVSTHEVSNAINTGLPHNGRVSVVVNKNDDGLGVGVTLGHNQVGAAEHRHSTWKTVLSIIPADIQALAEGRRLRAGERYRSADAVVDVRGLHNRVPADRLSFAVTQIARVCSVHGRVELLVHPGESWAYDPVNFTGLRSVGSEPHSCGQVLVFSRVAAKGSFEKQIQMKRSEPPAADLIVVGAKCRPDDARSWSVTTKTNGRRSVDVVSTTCLNTGIARLEAVAAVLGKMPLATVAMPADGIVCQHLLSDTDVTQVGLHDALIVLRRWSWARFGDGWLFGRIRQR